MTTVGEMIATLFDRYQRLYRDPRLAAAATCRRVNTALIQQPCRIAVKPRL